MNKSEILEFVAAKKQQAESALKARLESQKVWASGTDKSWRNVGCVADQAQRLRISESEGRIAAKLKHEIELFDALLELLVQKG